MVSERFDQIAEEMSSEVASDSGTVGGRISADEWVERTADARVSDEYPHRRDPEREPVHDNIDRPRWCPAGLTRSQKR